MYTLRKTTATPDASLSPSLNLHKLNTKIRRLLIKPPSNISQGTLSIDTGLQSLRDSFNTPGFDGLCTILACSIINKVKLTHNQKHSLLHGTTNERSNVIRAYFENLETVLSWKDSGETKSIFDSLRSLTKSNKKTRQLLDNLRTCLNQATRSSTPKNFILQGVGYIERYLDEKREKNTSGNVSPKTPFLEVIKHDWMNLFGDFPEQNFTPLLPHLDDQSLETIEAQLGRRGFTLPLTTDTTCSYASSSERPILTIEETAKKWIRDIKDSHLIADVYTKELMKNYLKGKFEQVYNQFKGNEKEAFLTTYEQSITELIEDIDTAEITYTRSKRVSIPLANINGREISIGDRIYVVDMSSPIGSGTSGNVYLATQKGNEHVAYVAKVISVKLNEHSEDVPRIQDALTIMNEIYVMQRRQHVNIMGIADAAIMVHPEVNTMHQIIMVMEKATPLESKFTEYAQIKDVATRHALIKKAFKDMLDGVEFLHNNNTIHCDLKPDNVMILDDVVKLIDLGSTLSAKQAATSSECFGSPGFGAPEIFDETRISERSTAIDIYSLGATFLYLLTNGKTLDEEGTLDSAKRLAQEYPDDLLPRLQDMQDLTDNQRFLISQMMHKNPACRPPIQEIKAQLDNCFPTE